MVKLDTRDLGPIRIERDRRSLVEAQIIKAIIDNTSADHSDACRAARIIAATLKPSELIEAQEKAPRCVFAENAR